MKDTTGSQDNMAADVQSYLISNYREALKKGDKSAAKSCLLAARYFSVNDPNVTNEIYIMAKSDGDVGEASKCLTNIFNDLFLVKDKDVDSHKTPAPELMTVINQMKEETRLLLGELKSHFLKLRSSPAPAGLGSRQTTSLNPSPMLSPRMRMSSEDGLASRESICKMDISHLHSSGKSLFYQQLFDNLPEQTKKDILDHSIETCENPFEQCRLIMLTLTIFGDSCSAYGTKLLKTLIDLSSATDKFDAKQQVCKGPRSTIMCHHANSLLALDAIPLVLNTTSLANLDIEVDELLEHTLNFYSRHCLEASASEHEANDLHEEVKKTIAARILGTEQNYASDELSTEDNVIATLNLLSQRYIETVCDTALKEKFNMLRELVADRKNLSPSFEQLVKIIDELNLDSDIPDEFLFARDNISGTSQPVVTPPPKSRGRPKKHVAPTVITSLDDGVKRHLLNKAREIRFVFHTIVQHMLVNCASYLKSTRSRILIDLNNPLASQLETELASKSSSQRTSRSKTGQHQQTLDNTAKRLKTDKQSGNELDREKIISENSPLNSAQSRMMDSNILSTLVEAHKCIEFLTSSHKSFSKLWQKFLAFNDKTQLKWYQRFSVDSQLMSGNFAKLSENLEESFQDDDDKEDSDVRMDQSISGTTTLTVVTGSSASIGVADLRKLVQLVSCNVQRVNKEGTYERIDELLSKMKHCGLFTNNEEHPKGNIIEEYIVDLQGSDDRLGFLFFDALSLLRYCVDILMSLLKKYTSNSSVVTDSSVGHSIVLSQFDWPRHYHVYDRSISWIRAHKPKSTTPQSLSASTKFTYTEFFHHIKNPNIIEDFMAMLCQGYTLDIKGSSSYLGAVSCTVPRDGSSSQGSTSSRSTNSSVTRSGKAITTRGVNKTFKEDLKVAMTVQMKSSSVLISLDMISEFMQGSLIPFLSSEG